MEEKERSMNYGGLANGIILKAVDDYRSARKTLARDPENALAQRQVSQCEKFFLSDWFTVLSSVDGSFVLKKLKAEEVKQ